MLQGHRTKQWGHCLCFLGYTSNIYEPELILAWTRSHMVMNHAGGSTRGIRRPWGHLVVMIPTVHVHAPRLIHGVTVDSYETSANCAVGTRCYWHRPKRTKWNSINYLHQIRTRFLGKGGNWGKPRYPNHPWNKQTIVCTQKDELWQNNYRNMTLVQPFFYPCTILDHVL